MHKFHFLGTKFLSEQNFVTKKFLFLGTLFHFKRNCHNPAFITFNDRKICRFILPRSSDYGGGGGGSQQPIYVDDLAGNGLGGYSNGKK